MRAQVLINVNVHTSFQIPTFTRSKDMTGTQKQKNRSREVTTPLSRCCVIRRLEIAIIILCSNN